MSEPKKERLVKLGDFKSAQEAATCIQCLPDGWILINPTETEQRLVDIYAEAFHKNSPDRIEVTAGGCE